MKSFNSAVAVTSLVLAIGATFASADANAVTSPRKLYANPTSYCQGALPSFEGAIRKRPLAVQNEGTTNAFVTCSFTSQGTFGASVNNPTSVQIWFNGINGLAIPISCTGVSGFQTGSNQFIVKSGTIPASGSQTSLVWSAADFTGAPANFPQGAFSVSCNLEPGAAINDSQVVFAEEIGT